MIVWILKDAEPLPLKSGQRALRAGLLAQELGRRGHQVVWWTSTFSHHFKKFIFERDTRLELMPNVTLLALDVGRYQRNVSFARLFHHRRLGRRFQELAPNEESPHIIVSALPIIDFPFQAARYASGRGVPLIVDVRDPWPAVFADKSPAPLRPLVRWLTLTERRRAAFSLKSAVALTAVSKGFLRWALGLAGRSQAPHDRVFYLGHSGFEPAQQQSPLPPGMAAVLDGRLVFTFVGTFGHSYEVELIAKAAQHFHAHRPDVAFVLVGDGHQRARIEQRYAGLKNLILTGWLDTNEVAPILSKSHVGLVSCRHIRNTVPNKPFEYLAAGLPLLSSIEGEMEEIIETLGLGLSYRAGDLAGFIQTVDRISGDRKALALWSANATKAFKEHFSASRIYPDFASHIELISELSRSGRAATAIPVVP
jgi:glycosyltransferase involved in cell wall biosynthesis